MNGFSSTPFISGIGRGTPAQKMLFAAAQAEFDAACANNFL